MKKKMCIFAVSFFAVVLFAGCGTAQKEDCTYLPEPTTSKVTENWGDYGIRVAVLYDSSQKDMHWKDTLGLLEQSVALGLEVEAVDISGSVEYSEYDILVPQRALLTSSRWENLATGIQSFTYDGGYVLLDNCFSQVLPMEYLGISNFEKLEGCPLELEKGDCPGDLTGLQDVVLTFAELYPRYYESEVLLQRDYGYGMIPSSAKGLLYQGKTALYTYNEYGEGGVLLTNALLPNSYSLGSFTMVRRDGTETAFASTTASCNQLLYSEFVSFVAKEKYGYSLNRVFGNHGSPSMSWELHYEEITGIANDSLQKFSALCQQWRQIPSFTLIRSSYWWFLRAESITYLLNESTSGLEYSMDLEESAYSSGTHIVSGNQWLSLAQIENAGSYFMDYPEYDFRAYPVFGDIDGDGTDELISGSSDGKFYCYEDMVFSSRLFVSESRQLVAPAGEPCTVAGYSAPQILHVDGDDIPDLISGSQDGCIYWFRGDGSGVFSPQGCLLQTDIVGQTLPAVGDLNRDGVPDLFVGSNQGILLVYYGQRIADQLTYDWSWMDNLSKNCANAELGTWVAPVYHEGELYVGTFEGYIAKLSGKSLEFQGWLTTDEYNYKGNDRLKFGTYCVPCFYDLNCDLEADLVCGSLEYGLAYPIDSPYFPYRNKLMEQIKYVHDNHLYMGVHHYTNAGASQQRESYELKRHLEAFDDYGLEIDGIGTNAHTWYTSAMGDTQTFDAQYHAGLLWNSGFSSPGDPGVAPQVAAENVIALPFLLQKDEGNTLLIQNNSVLPYVGETWTDISGRYKMPVCVYYHCDFVYLDDTEAQNYLEKVSQFQRTFGYNFMREDQLMEASAAAYSLQIHSKYHDGNLTLKALGGNMGAGIEIQFAERYQAENYGCDAEVWYREGNSLFLSVTEPVTLTFLGEESHSRLRQVNLPADIEIQENGARISFLDDGMMQVVVRGAAETGDTEWTVTTWPDHTIFTKYGDAGTLNITYSEESA